MRIRNFYVFLRDIFSNNEIALNNTSLVLDGHNFLHRMCQKPNPSSYFGCECNTHFNDVKEQLTKLQRANVKCYFIFRGGEEANDSNLLKPPLNEHERRLKVDRYSTYEPLFAREVFKETLDDMGLDYAICEYTNKRECVALSQRLNSAVLTSDTSFFFFGVKYICYFTLHYNPSDNILRAKLFSLEELMKKFQLDDRQVAIFITLFDENVLSKEIGDNLLRKLKLPLSYRCRYRSFFSWLSKKGAWALEIISKLITDDENRLIQSELKRNMEASVNVHASEGLVTKYFIDRNSCGFTQCDKEWFAKGVLWKFIPIPYINVYSYGILKGSWSIEDLDAEDSMLLSAPIVRYAFDLLTNFNNKDLKFIGMKRNRIENDEAQLFNDDGMIHIRTRIQKPDYGPNNVFENGWEYVSNHKLFEHFFKESVQVEMSALQKAPTETRLLIAALVYFARRKCVDVDNEAYAVLLSYVMLGPVDQATGRDKTLDDEHCKLARAILDEYFTVSDTEVESILDRKMLHPLVEFQHCLRHFNFLNTLCGSSLAPTVYSKTFNATFVYKVLYDIKRNYNGVGNIFIEHKLGHAVTVMSFVKKLFNIFVEMKLETI